MIFTLSNKETTFKSLKESVYTTNLTSKFFLTVIRDIAKNILIFF